jgi:hypothetical protein
MPEPAVDRAAALLERLEAARELVDVRGHLEHRPGEVGDAEVQAQHPPLSSWRRTACQ